MPNYYYVSDIDYARTFECDSPLYEGDYLMSIVHPMRWWEFDASSSTVHSIKWLYKLVVF